MNWYASQQSQVQSNSYKQSFAEKQSDNDFESIYDDVFTNHYDFWMPLLEDNEEDYWFQVQNQQMIFQGKLFQKHPKTRKWEPQHLELFQDKFVRVTPMSDDTVQYEYCRLNQCFLKKIKYSESSFQSYKFGFRLQIGKKKAEFFTETNEIFMKWYQKMVHTRHNQLKRFTLLPKFSKKYKLVTKIKISEPFQASSTYKTIKLADNCQYQVRVIEKHQLSEQQRLQLLKEIKILRRLDHPNVSRLLEVYEDANFLYMVFEPYAGREIKYRLQELVTASERVIAELLYKLLQAVNHCHSKNVFHRYLIGTTKRDIKFDSIFHRFPTSLTEICLANFSTADIYDAKTKGQFKKIGTPGFLAPEVFKSKYYDTKVDIFSIGVLFYFFVFARMPFGNEYNEIMYNNEQGDIDLNQRSRFTTSAIDLMCLMVKKDPNKRINAFQAMNHHWFINMKIKEQVSRNLQPRQQLPSVQNLSTIIEKSDILDISCTSMANVPFPQRPSPSRPTKPQTRSKSTELGVLDEEFVYGSLSEKLDDLKLLCPPKVPSKSRHVIKGSLHSGTTSPERTSALIQQQGSNPNNFQLVPK